MNSFKTKLSICNAHFKYRRCVDFSPLLRINESEKKKLGYCTYVNN